MIDLLMSLIAPKLPRLTNFSHSEEDSLEDGILWRAYDVRLTGIEKKEKGIYD